MRFYAFKSSDVFASKTSDCCRSVCVILFSDENTILCYVELNLWCTHIVIYFWLYHVIYAFL